MKRAATLQLGNLPAYRYGVETYDSTKLGLGKLMVQRSGPANTDDWAGPLNPIEAPLRLAELTGAQWQMPWAVEWVDSATANLDWVFFADGGAAAATRKIALATYNRLTGEWLYKGFVTLTYPTATNHTIRAMRMTYDKYTTGTVSVSGVAVTGVGTAWLTDRQCVGSRIGFGSTDPAAISTWHEINAIGADGSITLTSSAGTIAAGTPYVIEDLRCVTVTSNATATNGGPFVAKGLRFENFTLGGTTIPAATTVDNIRAVYWLKDAATITNTAANGCGLQAKTDWQTQYLWSGNGTTTQQLFKHNLRAALTLTSGAATNQFQFSTAVSAALTGTATQNNNGRVANAASGPGAGVDCYYFTTATRVYRTKALSTITASDSTFLTAGDVMTPIWPGGASALMAGSAPNTIQHLEYASSLDLFVIPNALLGANRIIASKYKTDGTPAERVLLTAEHGVTTITTAAIAVHGYAEPLGSSGGVWAEDGLLYTANIPGTTNGGVWAIPIGADWEYASTQNARLVLPAIALADCDRITGIFAQETQVIGLASGYNTGAATNPHRIIYRTAGISDNSGAWTSVDASGIVDIAGVSQIQLAFEFRTMGAQSATSRIHSVAVVYDDNNTLSQYQFSVNESSAASKQFAWRHATAFGSAVPALKVRLYDAVTGSLLVTDTTSAPTGTWERSTDGTSYSAWTNTDKANETTYVRYTPASIADGVQVRAVLTLA